MRWPVIFLLAVSGAWAQTGPSNPLVESSKVFYSNAKQDILRSAEKMPEDKYTFKPIDSVRSYGQLVAHVADGQYEFCGAAASKHDEKGIEQTAKTKADIVAALKAAFAYCDAIYAGMTDAKAAEMIPAFGGAKITRLSMLDFNVSHTMEHYGNVVTYLRIEGLVPPSSEPRRSAVSALPSELNCSVGDVLMPFVDINSLNVVERLPGWHGRYFHSPSMTFSHYSFTRGASIHEHFHPQEEVYEVIEGELELTIDGLAQIARAGVVGIVPGNAPHSVKALSDGQVIVVDYPRRLDVDTLTAARPQPE